MMLPRKQNKIFDLFLIACIYFLVDALLPALQFYSTVYITILFTLLIYFRILIKGGYFNSFVSSFGLMFLLILVSKLWYSVTTKEFVIAIYQTLLIFTPILIALFFIKSKNLKAIKMLLQLSILLLFITSVTSIIGLNEYPLASRQLATGMHNDSNASVYSRMNIAGFSVVYMIPVIVPLLVPLFLNDKRKLFYLPIVLLTSAYFVYVSMYTIAIISLAVVLWGVIVANKFSWVKFIGFAIIALLFAVLFKNSILTFTSEIADTQSIEVSTRLNAIVNKLSGEQSYSETLEGRENAYMLSIQTFFRSPIFGGLIFNKGLPGGHSFILDMFANFGIIGVVVVFSFYRTIYKRLYLPFKHDPSYGFMLISFLVSIFLALFNTSPNILATGLLAPAVGMILRSNTSVYKR